MTSPEPTAASASDRAVPSDRAVRSRLVAPLTAAGTGVVLVAVSAVLLLHHRSLPSDFGSVPGGDGPPAAAVSAVGPSPAAPPSAGAVRSPSTAGAAPAAGPSSSAAPTDTAVSSTGVPPTRVPSPATTARPAPPTTDHTPAPRPPRTVAPTKASPPARPATAVDRRQLPQQLVLPRFGVRADVLPVTSTAGSLAVPDDPQQVGWWTGSALPGSTTGTTVIDGHIDSATRGIGALIHLADLVPGDRIGIVGSTGRTLQYDVVARRVYVKKAGLPPTLFAPGGPERLLLISCGGPFDSARGSYEDNIVVFATPTAD